MSDESDRRRTYSRIFGVIPKGTLRCIAPLKT